MRTLSPSIRVRFQISIVAAALFSTVATAGVGVWTTNGPPNALGSVFVIADPLRPGTLYVSEFDNSNPYIPLAPYKSTDDGATWTQLSYVVQSPIPLATAPPNTVYFSQYGCGQATCTYPVDMSTDGGTTWRYDIDGDIGTPTVALVVDPVAPTTLFLGQSYVPIDRVSPTVSSLLKSTDGGATWTHMDTGLGLDSAVIAKMIGTKVSGTIYVLTETVRDPNATHGLFKTVDGGATWTQLTNAPSFAQVLAADPTNANVIYAVTCCSNNGETLLKSVDGGASFATINAGLPISVTSFVINPAWPANVFVGTNPGGVFRSSDGGATLQPMNAGLSDLNVGYLAIDGNGSFLHAGTQNAVFDYQLSSCTPDTHTLCLNDGRFSVTADFQQTSEGPSAPATAIPLTNDTGYFWFFDAANVEMVVKVLTGCPVNGEYWVFAGGLTNVGVEWKVTDTLTGTSKSYSNAFGTPFQPIQDSSAFPCQ